MKLAESRPDSGGIHCEFLSPFNSGIFERKFNMKTYTPDRSPTRRLNLPPVQDEKDAKRVSASGGGFRLRRFIVLFSAAGIITLGLVSIAVLQKEFRILTARSQGLASSIAGLRAEVDAKNAQIQTLEFSLKSAIADRDRLKESLSTTGQQLEKALNAGSSTKTLLEKIQEQLQQLISVQSVRSDQSRQTQEALEKLRREHFEQLLATGELLSGDPAIALQTLNDAMVFATANGISEEAARMAAETLPHAATLPEGSKITIVDARLEGTQIVADVSVTDAAGKFLPSMSRVDFEVESRNRRLHLVSVASVERNDRQQNIVVLLDNSGSTTGGPHAAMQQAAIELVKRIANPSQLIIYSFDNDARSISPWTIDAALHQAAIQQLAPDGGTALFKGLRLAKEDLSKQSAPRSIVLFADGDNSVLVEDIEKTLAACREHSIVIHVVALKTGDINEPMLRRIASETSGLYLSASDPTRLAEQFRTVAATFLQPAYRIRIYEPVEADQLTLRVGSLAAVPLTVNKAGLSVSAGT